MHGSPALLPDYMLGLYLLPNLTLPKFHSNMLAHCYTMYRQHCHYFMKCTQ